MLSPCQFFPLSERGEIRWSSILNCSNAVCLGSDLILENIITCPDIIVHFWSKDFLIMKNLLYLRFICKGWA